MTCLLLRTSALRSAHRPALLEAFPAKHRPPLCGTEGDCGFLPALRAIGLRFRAHRGRRARIPWACGHEAETRTQNFPALRGPDSRKCGAEPRRKRKGDPGATGTARYD